MGLLRDLIEASCHDDTGQDLAFAVGGGEAIGEFGKLVQHEFGEEIGQGEGGRVSYPCRLGTWGGGRQSYRDIIHTMADIQSRARHVYLYVHIL